MFGAFNFDGRATGLNGGVGNAFADLLLGRAASYNETNTVAFNDNRRNSFEVLHRRFLEDDPPPDGEPGAAVLVLPSGL